MEAVASGLLYYTITALKHILKSNAIPNMERTNISIVIYNESNVSVFKFVKNCTPECLKIAFLGQFIDFKTLIVNEVNNQLDEKQKFFLPVPLKYLSVNIEDYLDEILLCMDMLEKFAIKDNTQITNSNNSNVNKINKTEVKKEVKHVFKNLFLHAVNLGRYLIKNKGGKLILFNSGNVEMEINKAFNPEEVVFGYHTNDYITFFARELCKDRISISIFLTYRSYTVRLFLLYNF